MFSYPDGVDVFGQREGEWCGFQCKGRRIWPPKPLNVTELNRGSDMLQMREMLEMVLAGQRLNAIQATMPMNAIQATMPTDGLPSDKRSEDPALHERIDAMSGLMNDGEPHPARKQLLAVP